MQKKQQTTKKHEEFHRGQKVKWILFTFNTKGALAWYGKLTWESAHAWILKILCYLIVWGITLIFMVHLSFYAIPLLINDVINDNVNHNLSKWFRGIKIISIVFGFNLDDKA